MDGASFRIEEGKSLGVAGESGCGKSTLALSMMGYYFPPLHYTRRLISDVPKIHEEWDLSTVDPKTE